MWLLLQITMPEVPKTGDISGWFGWVVTVLFLVIACALTYLITKGTKAEGETKELLGKLILSYDAREQVSDERLKEAEGRLAHAWLEHDKNRVAFIHQQDEIAKTLLTIAQSSDQNHREVTEKLGEIREDLRGKRS